MRRLRLRFAIVAVIVTAAVGLLIRASLQSLALERRIRQQTIAERIFDEMERSLSRILADEEERPVAGFTGATAPAPPFVVRRYETDAGDSGARRLGEHVADAPLPATEPGPVAEAVQAPGTTLALADLRAAAARKRAPSATGAGADGSAYDVLRSLNKAVAERRSERSDEAAVPAVRGKLADDEGAPPSPATRDAFAEEPFPTGRMSGRAVRNERFLLYRLVVRDGALYHQGTLIDVAALGGWLRTRLHENGGLSGQAGIEFFTGAAAPLPAAANGGADVYVHRFGAPFADLSAHLHLRPLAARASDTYVHALAALLLAATLAGLFLLYRAVAVTLRFAERRANFVAAVSHELKTPLTAIRMYGEMLRDGIVASDARRDEYYRHITSEAERLSRLINNVLEHANLEQGERSLAPIEASIVPTIEEVAQAMRSHAELNGFQLRVEASAGLPGVRFDADALKQILWNLLDNAIKYAAAAPAREIVIRADRDGDCVRLAVSDRGPGVDARHLGQIFDAFYRAENEHTRSSKGAGLGLSLVRALADRMAATVNASNLAGGGFTVELRFPIAA